MSRQFRQIFQIDPAIGIQVSDRKRNTRRLSGLAGVLENPDRNRIGSG